MNIQPVRFSTVRAFYSSGKIVSFGQNQSKNDVAKRVTEPNLSTYITLMSNKMNVDSNIRFFVGGLSKIDTNSKRKREPLEIADIGCCDGALCRKLSEFLPQIQTITGLIYLKV